MNRAKIVEIITRVVSTGLLVFFIYGIVHILDKKKVITDKLEYIPKVEFYQLNGKSFMLDNLQKNRPFIFVYFQSDCDLCLHEINSIINQLSDFEEMQLIFISSDNTDIISTFAKQRKIANKPNVIFLQDKHLIFPIQFDIETTPCTLLYDKNRKLIKRFKGQILAKTILKEWKKHEEK